MNMNQENNIYYCDACRYTFFSKENVEQCPDCGKFKVRPATKKEREEYYQYRKDFI